MRVEHEYERCGAWAYLAALDVHRAKSSAVASATTGIAPFDRLVDQVMTQPPYSEAAGSSGSWTTAPPIAGEARVRRLHAGYPQLVPVHGPVHASWLNQIEIYFSIIQRKVLTPNDFACSGSRRRAARFGFERYYERSPRPFEWKFTRADLNALIARMRSRYAQTQQLKLAA